MSRSRKAFTEVLRLCLVYGSKMGYGDSFIQQLRAILPFILFPQDESCLQGELLQAFLHISADYQEKLAVGVEDAEAVRGHVLSGLCEKLTRSLLDREQPRLQVFADVFAFLGPNRIPVKNSANLDCAASTRINRDIYWELFECKQNPSMFFEPYLWRDEADPNRAQRWQSSQVRLAMAVLAQGGPFASVTVVSYHPKPTVLAFLRRLPSVPSCIGVYAQGDAWEKLPWCQIGD